MTPALFIRMRPTGPWRFGSASGDAREVDHIYHSDSLYSAVSNAMETLGQLEAWLGATALSPTPEVRFASCFPWMGENLFVPPPASLWPPASPKARFKAAAFVPLSVVEQLAAGQQLEDGKWTVDAPSRCLVPATTGGASSGPLRVRVRNRAAVDRVVPGRTLAHRTACVEFAPDSGLWTLVTFSNEEARDRWRDPVAAAFRLLADTGFGGRRSLGWGRAEQPGVKLTTVEEMFPIREIVKAKPPAEESAPLMPFAYIAVGGARPAQPEPADVPKTSEWWLLSLFCPDPTDELDWETGSYRVIERGGRVGGSLASGETKRLVRMIAEGGVVLSERPPLGKATDVRPDGFPRPVFGYGHPVAVGPINGAAQ